MLLLARAKLEIGSELMERVGVEPSGDPFNSLVQLEYERGVPRNPMINAGAIVVCDVLVEFRVGLPAKSDVGGCSAAVHSGHYAVAVWSPRLNSKGNSAASFRALELLTDQTGRSIF